MSTLKVDTVDTRTGSGNITFSRPTVLTAGDIVTADVADNAITLAKMAGGTDGQIITYDASGDPVAVGPGTDGQVLTSTGAGSPPAFEAAAAGGAWNIIGTSVASNSASLTQTGISATYDTYVVCLSDMVPATDGAHPWFRFGDSGGIDSGGSDYTYKTETSAHNSNNYAGIGSTGAAQIAIGNAVGGTAGEGYMATLFINHPGDGTGQARVLGNYVVISDTPQTGGGSIVGNRAAVLTLTQVQFLFSTGNIATGRMTLYGVAHA